MEVFIKENGTAHEDLILSFKEMDLLVISDTYYFEIEDTIQPERDSSCKIAASLKSLLSYWIENIINLGSKEERYLPIDFSDQYTGCFKIRKVSTQQIEISYGYSLREGWSVCPSDPKEYAISIHDYKETSSKLLIGQDELIEQIVRSQERL
ncbi:hypothetical protein BBD42_16295 [Paenibacillus sp. BIHB 4019]|uniref:Uncharacterized protein n=1 Tax=Paenibacillus sp. BIHB 4019 TaxID=1870819 RepID=A0A1B2DJI1_9BACL|nr:hypothetical protein [Paenibacillus sp. BIHB 4019]ANY67859.1 hypothetical protein BBD42_16295 [Paenibacillus sp. BIHB 4019]